MQGALAVCVVDNLSGVHTPKKIGPMLKMADVVAITKGDIVSQAEREVFAHNVWHANPLAQIVSFNGLTGQGAGELAFHMRAAPDLPTLEGRRLRFVVVARAKESKTVPLFEQQLAVGRAVRWPPSPKVRRLAVGLADAR